MENFIVTVQYKPETKRIPATYVVTSDNLADVISQLASCDSVVVVSCPDSLPF